MEYDVILAFDPSGNFDEGKGTTGWCILDKKERLLDCGEIKAENFNCKEEYWDTVVTILRAAHQKYPSLIVVIEEYILYREKSRAQTNSKMETCRLIGVLQWACYRMKQPYSMQLAASVKNRWRDDLLIREGFVNITAKGLTHIQSNRSLQVIHIRDAFRHAIHYVICRNGNEGKRKERRIPQYEQSNYRESDDRFEQNGRRYEGSRSRQQRNQGTYSKSSRNTTRPKIYRKKSTC